MIDRALHEIKLSENEPEISLMVSVSINQKRSIWTAHRRSTLGPIFFLCISFPCSPVARFTERLITYLSPKTYLTTHLRPETCLILKICIKTCHKSILVVN